MRRVLVDSSAFLSLEDPDERSHLRARRTLEELVGSGGRLLTTNFVFDETYTLILTRLGRARAVAWEEVFRQGQLVQLLRLGGGSLSSLKSRSRRRAGLSPRPGRPGRSRLPGSRGGFIEQIGRQLRGLG